MQIRIWITGDGMVVILRPEDRHRFPVLTTVPAVLHGSQGWDRVERF